MPPQIKRNDPTNTLKPNFTTVSRRDHHPNGQIEADVLRRGAGWLIGWAATGGAITWEI
jgi:hypothetical protein